MAQINKPSEYFNTKLYTGNASTQSITGVGFQPDWVWIKNRSITADHKEFDAVRGVTNALITNSDVAEFSQSGLDSFDSDGFTVGSHVGCNGNGNSIVAWNWLGANGTASNTDGSITSTVSANTTSGFSIVSYTGTGSSMSVGHGLSQKPDIVIFKNRDAVVNWGVYTDLIDGSYDFLYLNETNAKGDSGSYSASANTFSFSASSTVANTSGEKVIGYCFHSVKGFSKMGTYTGNGSTDGPFIYTGFKPAWVMWKKYNNIEDWEVADNKRLGYNPSNYKLVPNSSSAESTSIRLDFLSNGFKIRSLGGPINASGDSFIYMAFAENPLVGTNNIPATAR